MLEALRPNRARSAVKRTIPVKAPIRGWSDRAATEELGSEYAIVLENYIPDEGGASLRPGYSSHVTGIGEEVGAFLTYKSGSIAKLFAATASDIYDVTSAGAVGAAVVSSLSNGNWSSVMFSTSGGDFLVGVNGADGVRSYDGTTWATQSIIGVSASDLAYVAQHKERLWFIEDGTLNAWYLDVLNIAGAATKLPLGSVFEKGGELTSIFTWSRDGGAGLDDVLVFMTDQGEAALYQGTNPASASDWSLVGVFTLDKPMSRNCWVKSGADVLILTRSGPISMTRAFAAEDITKASSKDVRQSFRDAAAALSTATGWQMIHDTTRGWFFANVPTSTSSDFDQYLVNSINGAWCKLKDIPACTWGDLDGVLYFADSSGVVYKGFDGANDNGANITGRCITGFDRFGHPTEKDFKSVAVYMRADADPTPLVEMRADFDTTNSTASAQVFQPDFSAIWDVALWDEAEWAPDPTAVKKWYGVSAKGAVGAIYIQTQSKNAELSILGFNINYEPGDGF